MTDSNHAPSRAPNTSAADDTPARPVPAALDGLIDWAGLSTAAQSFAHAIADKPDLPMRLAKMALVFRTRKMKADAKALAQAAMRLAPKDYPVRVLTEWLQRREAPLWHFPMLHDAIRNQAYADALRQFVTPGMIVFEIGTGTGLLAMLAAQAGAAHVYTCERRDDVADAARAIIARNGFSDRITVIGKDAHDLRLGEDLPQRADLFVAELVDNSLLADQVLPLTELARAKFLKPDAVLLPRAVSAMGYLITGKGHWQKYRVEQVMGFDLTPFNRFTPVEINAGKGGGELEPLTAAVELARFDLHQDAPAEARHQVRLVAERAGRAEALLRWLRLDFGEGLVFENRPPQCSHWDPQLHLLPEARWMDAGAVCAMTVSHNRERLFLWPREPADVDGPRIG